MVYLWTPWPHLVPPRLIQRGLHLTGNILSSSQEQPGSDEWLSKPLFYRLPTFAKLGHQNIFQEAVCFWESCCVMQLLLGGPSESHFWATWVLLGVTMWFSTCIDILILKKILLPICFWHVAFQNTISHYFFKCSNENFIIIGIWCQQNDCT